MDLQTLTNLAIAAIGVLIALNLGGPKVQAVLHLLRKLLSPEPDEPVAQQPADDDLAGIVALQEVRRRLRAAGTTPADEAKMLDPLALALLNARRGGER